MGIRSRKPARSTAPYRHMVDAVAANRFIRARGFFRKDIRHVMDLLVAEIYKSLVEFEEVRIPGFGRFYRIYKNARNVRNPRTKELMLIPGRYEVRFSMGSSLKYTLGNKVPSLTTHLHKVLAKERDDSKISIPRTPSRQKTPIQTDM